MRVQPKRTRVNYAQGDIQAMLTDPKRGKGPYSYLHPQISPSGLMYQEDKDALGVVSDAKRRYIKQGWMPNRRVSDAASTRRDLTALMSMEGALTPDIHNAIQGYGMFQGALDKIRAVPQQPALSPFNRDLRVAKEEAWEHYGDQGQGYADLVNIEQGQPRSGLRTKMHHRNVRERMQAAGHGDEYARRESFIFEEYRSSQEQSKMPSPKDVPPSAPDSPPGMGAFRSATPSPPSKKKRGGKRTGGTSTRVTSESEHVDAAQSEVVLESGAPDVVEEPKKKIRRRMTEKKKLRQECDDCGVSWRKSWNTKKLKSVLSGVLKAGAAAAVVYGVGALATSIGGPLAGQVVGAAAGQLASSVTAPSKKSKKVKKVPAVAQPPHMSIMDRTMAQNQAEQI